MRYRWCSLAVLGVMLLALAGCVVPPGGPPRVVVEGDAFSKQVTILGVQILDNPLLDLNKAHWYLRSFVNPEAHTAQHQLYAELTYTGERNGTYFAADNQAQPYRVDLIYRGKCDTHSRNEVCVRVDTIGVDISEAMLRSSLARGLDVKVTARSGYARVLEITPLMISAQLNASQQILSGKVVVGRTVKSGDTIVAGP